MVKSCSAIGCANRSQKGTGISFYRFPTEPTRRGQWIVALRRKNWTPTKNSWLCSEHFISGKKSEEPLCPDFVPSVFKFIASPVKRKQKRSLETYERRKRRRLFPPSTSQSTLASSEILATADAYDPPVSTAWSSGPNFIPPDYPATTTLEERPLLTACEVAALQRSNNQLQDETSKLRTENEELADSNVLLRRQLAESEKENKQLHSSSVLSEESLAHDDHGVKLYTGLPSYAVLMVVFEFVACDVPDHHRSKLSRFKQFLLVLMKLRLNLTDGDLARRFGVSQSTVSKLTIKWINIMYVRLKPLVLWPDREDLQKTMPKECATYFKNCVCIIDCFEVFCERPSGLMARAQTFSNYKHHNAVKFLIGITPQGVISFISKGWGGRTSDKYLTEHCDILKNLVPGDQLMADRGFTIHESVGSYGAELVIPPFTRGKKQLSQAEVDKARQLSRVRIHVERVIGLLRNKYTFLQSTVPISLLMHADGTRTACAMDKIAMICCALCNCCESVVPLK